MILANITQKSVMLSYVSFMEDRDLRSNELLIDIRLFAGFQEVRLLSYLFL
jgi:hypothetical protein